MSYRPEFSSTPVKLTYDVNAVDETARTTPLEIPAERPLTVYVDQRELVTLMTLGAAPEALTLGYLRNQRLVQTIEEVVAVHVDWNQHAVHVTTRDGIANIEERTAKRVVTTGCGQGTMFGGLMDEIDSISLPTDARLRQSTLYKIVNTIRMQDSVYAKAGSVHGCGLFTAEGELLHFIEDVGRHNAVDSIAGIMWLENISGADKVFYTTGRLTSEMVIKGAQMGMPFLISRSGTTQMGHLVAEKVNMTLLARCTGKHFLLVTGKERMIYEPHLLDSSLRVA
ncbi:sulfurtransferase FdhD [Herminiimonas sp. KBW02]|uniref:formate dehydrogenase accessory sulfurtransferase FdhD n=1 Tax=Herminiimonas sp. KBW02 TaxID=2153363 RepID=UPI000F5B8662|nr:formate dehydrogenase accessory sulfurtransferase FdhD [Herminiimonas sp. KBW02]RQO38659.1 sulfurtransferase FdhD [Herminiimonas sp. KBW02]